MESNPRKTAKRSGSEERSEDAPHQLTEEEKACDHALYEAYCILFRAMHEREIKEFAWAERAATWLKDETRNLWTCDVPPNRAMVMLEKGDWFWVACIKRRALNEYRRFLDLEEAVVWAEEQLAGAEVEAEPEVEASPAPVAGHPIVDLGPYRIDPTALEPERITYRVVIELDAMPEHYKTVEVSNGRQLRYEQRYLSPRRLAAELQIDEAECELERWLGPNDGWNLGHSTVTYYRESVAVEQAQLMWSKSRIVEQYRKGKLLRARYGVKEVETGYRSWLGGCENPEQPWGKPQTRAEYLAEKAEELTLANALDVEGFREFIGWCREEVSDEQILGALHYKRAHSPAIPVAGRSESKGWLSDHPDWRA